MCRINDTQPTPEHNLSFSRKKNLLSLTSCWRVNAAENSKTLQNNLKHILLTTDGSGGVGSDTRLAGWWALGQRNPREKITICSQTELMCWKASGEGGRKNGHQGTPAWYQHLLTSLDRILVWQNLSLAPSERVSQCCYSGASGKIKCKTKTAIHGNGRKKV